jgi:hypothetical protein
MALVLAAGAMAFGCKPAISPRTLEKPRITWDRSVVRAVRMSIACGARQESGYHLKASAPAASTDAIPKGASPLAAGGSWLAEHSQDFDDPCHITVSASFSG